jgi:hypothetical protein
MSKVKTIPVVLMAMFLFSAVTAASASALPEFVKTAGTYPIKFTGKATAPGMQPPTVKSSAGTVECTNETLEGEFAENGMQAKKISVRFTGCKGPMGFACTTAGQTSGTIVINELMGYLGYDSQAKKTTVLALLPAAAKLETQAELENLTVAEFTCAGMKIVVKGKGIVGKIGSLNVKAKEFKLTFSAAPAQEFSTVELLENNTKGEKIKHTDVLLEVGETEATLVTEDTITLPAGVEGEIKG